MATQFADQFKEEFKEAIKIKEEVLHLIIALQGRHVEALKKLDELQ